MIGQDEKPSRSFPRSYVAMLEYPNGMVLYANYDPRSTWDHYLLFGTKGNQILHVMTDKIDTDLHLRYPPVDRRIRFQYQNKI